MPSRMRLHRAEQATWSTTYVTCFYSAPCAGDLVLRSLSLLSWRRASPSQPEFVVAASVARLGRLLQCCFAVVDARGTRMAIDADARPEKHDGRVELVGRVVPVASRDEGHRPTRAHVHPGRSDGRSGCCHRATQEHEFHLESSHYEIFDLEIDLTITLLSRSDAGAGSGQCAAYGAHTPYPLLAPQSRASCFRARASRPHSTSHSRG